MQGSATSSDYETASLSDKTVFFDDKSGGPYIATFLTTSLSVWVPNRWLSLVAVSATEAQTAYPRSVCESSEHAPRSPKGITRTGS